MRYMLLLLALAILVSGCVSMPWQKSQIGPIAGTTSVTNTDMSMSVAAVPAEVREEKNMSVNFDITNTQQSDLYNININVYETCGFRSDQDGFTYHKDNLTSNRTLRWNPRWTAPAVQFDTDCEIKFRTSWEGNASLSQSVTVLSDAEYTAREAAGTLGDITAGMSASNSPVSITITFGSEQPWADNETVSMFIDYTDTGGGFIDNLASGSVKLTMPDNIKDSDCNHYTGIDLNRNLSFINKAAPRSTCTFSTKAGNSPVSTGTISLTANYKYELDNSFTIKIKNK